MNLLCIMGESSAKKVGAAAFDEGTRHGIVLAQHGTRDEFYFEGLLSCTKD